MEIGMLILRLTVGLTLAAHGAQKLFGWFGGPGLDGAGQGMAMLGFAPGRRHALMAGLVETGGGLLLALGLFTPLASSLVSSVMLVAAFSAHVKRGFFAATGGYEYNLVLGVAGASLAFTGPGRFSIDALLGLVRPGAAIGLAAMAIGAAAATVQLARRRVPQQPQAAAAS